MKKILLASIILTIFMLLFGFSKNNGDTSSTEKNSANQNALDVSIIQLISNPDKYNGKIVRMIDVGNLEFEGDAIYLSKDDWEYRIAENGLWIELGGKATDYSTAKDYNGKYVIIEGTFNKENTGHFGMYSGAVEKISRYESWEDKINAIKRN